MALQRLFLCLEESIFLLLFLALSFKTSLHWTEHPFLLLLSPELHWLHWSHNITRMCLPPLDSETPNRRGLLIIHLGDQMKHLTKRPEEVLYQNHPKGWVNIDSEALPFIAESVSLRSETLPGNSYAHECFRTQYSTQQIWWIKRCWKVLRSLVLKICTISFIPLGYIFAGGRSREFGSVMDQSDLMGKSRALFSNQVMRSTYCPFQMPNY